MQVRLDLHPGDALSSQTVQITSNHSQDFCLLLLPTPKSGEIRRGWAAGWLGSSVFDISTELILKSSLVGQSWPQTSLRLLTCNIFVILSFIPVLPPSHQDLLRQWWSILMTKHLSHRSIVALWESKMESVHWDVRPEWGNSLVDWRYESRGSSGFLMGKKMSDSECLFGWQTWAPRGGWEEAARMTKVVERGQ